MIRNWVIIFSVLAPQLVSAYSSNLNFRDQEEALLGLYSETLETESQVDLADVLISDLWSLNKRSVFKIKNKSKALWFRLCLESRKGEELYLVSNSPNIDKMTLFRNGKMLGETGDVLKRSNRSLKDDCAAILFESGGYDTLYCRLEMAEDFIIPIVIRTKDTYLEKRSTKQLLTGCYVGLMVAIMLYNILLFISIRHRLFILYSFYILVVTCTQLSVFSDISTILYPESVYLGARDIFIYSSVLGVAIGPFVIELLSLFKTQVFLAKLVVFFICCFLISTLISLFGSTTWSATVLSVLNLTSSVLLLIIGVSQSIRSPIGRIFLVAWGAFILGAILFIIQGLKVIPYSTLTNYSMTVGTSIEAILLSLALGYHVKELVKSNQVKSNIIIELSTELAQLSQKYRITKVKVLQIQMNPHFLFNALGSIQSYVLLNPTEKSIDFIGEYSKLFRNQLESSLKSRVSIKSTINDTDNYLRIEHLKSPGKFQYTIKTYGLNDDDLEDLHIPPGLIQPVVENSIVHAFRGKKEVGQISVDIKRSKILGYIEIVVKDNGSGFKLGEQKNHISRAMEIIQDSLTILREEQEYDQTSIEVASNSNGTNHKSNFTNFMKAKTKILIVDDQEDIRKLLRGMLESRDDLKVVGEAADSLSAIELLKKLKVDLMLLDIEMPGGSGLSVIEAFDRPTFKTIIVTAHSEYTIQALKLAAVDYLLKPVTYQRA